MDLKIERRNIIKLNSYFKIFLFLLISINLNASNKCYYKSEFFDSNNIVNNLNILNNKVTFKLIKDETNKSCKTELLFNNQKFGEIPKNNDVYKCNFDNAYRESSFIVNAAFNNDTKLLALHVIHEFSIVFARGGISPFYTEELIIYKFKNGILTFIDNTNKKGWGDGYIFKSGENIICNEPSFIYKNIKNYISKTYFLLKKQPLYSSPNKKTKMYLIKGDTVEILKEKDEWLYILYRSKEDIKAWIPKSAIEKEEIKQPTKTIKKENTSKIEVIKEENFFSKLLNFFSIKIENQNLNIMQS